MPTLNSYVFKPVYFENLQLLAKIAEVFAKTLEVPAIVFLSGELGTGKTTFTQYFLKALGYPGLVRSPTFSIIECYPFSECLKMQKNLEGQLCHFDFYRIQDLEELEALGIREYMQTQNLIFIEWPQKAVDLKLNPDLIIELDYDRKGRTFSCSSKTQAGYDWMKRMSEQSQII